MESDKKSIKENKWVKLWFRLCDDMKDMHIGAYASSSAFFTFLSLMPMMLVFFSVVPFTPITEASILQIVKQIVPPQTVPLAISVVDEMYGKRNALLSINILITIWSAAKGTMALVRGINVINGIKDKRNYFVVRFKACLYTLVMLLSILIVLALVVFGEKIWEGLLIYFPDNLVINRTPQLYVNILGLNVDLVYLFNFRTVIVVAFQSFCFCACYTWLPEKAQKSPEDKNCNKALDDGTMEVKALLNSEFFSDMNPSQESLEKESLLEKPDNEAKMSMEEHKSIDEHKTNEEKKYTSEINQKNDDLKMIDESCINVGWWKNFIHKSGDFWIEFPGALMAAFVWYLSSLIFSAYVNSFATYSTYGSIGTVMAVMIWLYFGFYILLIGAFVNQAIKPYRFIRIFKRKRKEKKKEKKDAKKERREELKQQAYETVRQCYSVIFPRNGENSEEYEISESEGD